MSTVSPDSVAQDQLKAIVRRVEAIEDEIKVLNEDKSEIYKEAKGNGFDNKIIRKVIAERRKNGAERAEQDALFQLYWDAIHGVAHAHVEIIKEFDPETGEIAGNGAGGADDVVQVAAVRAASSANSFPTTNHGGGHEYQGVAKEPKSSTEAAKPDGLSAAVNCDADMAAGAGSSAGGSSGVPASDVEPVAPHSDPAEKPKEPDGGFSAPAIERRIREGSSQDEAEDAGVTAGETAPHSEPASPPSEIAEPGDRGAVVPSAAPVVAANVVSIRSHNPGTHFLNSDGLPRLLGCLKADKCAGSWRALCFDCSRLHDGPAVQPGAA